MAEEEQQAWEWGVSPWMWLERWGHQHGGLQCQAEELEELPRTQRQVLRGGWLPGAGQLPLGAYASCSEPGWELLGRREGRKERERGREEALH